MSIDNSTSIAAIMARVDNPQVTVAGHTLTLYRPTREEVERETAETTGDELAVDTDAMTEDEKRRRNVSLTLRVAERAVVTCVPDIDGTDAAFGLIQASGGVSGELAQTCLSLCGLGGGLGGVAERDPTRSSSGESSG